jgi:hypothetical protein
VSKSVRTSHLHRAPQVLTQHRSALPLRQRANCEAQRPSQQRRGARLASPAPRRARRPHETSSLKRIAAPATRRCSHFPRCCSPPPHIGRAVAPRGAVPLSPPAQTRPRQVHQLSRSCVQMRSVVRRRKSAPPSTRLRQTSTVLRQAASMSAVQPSHARKSMSAPTCVSTSRMSPHRPCLAAWRNTARRSLHRTFASPLHAMALERERHRAVGGGMFSATSSSPGGCVKCASV